MGAMQSAFVKFFGRAGTRTAWDAPVLDVLTRTGAHWVGTYPAGRRPRSVRDGEFLAGTLADAVSLGELMDALGAEGRAAERDAAGATRLAGPQPARLKRPATSARIWRASSIPIASTAPT
jgi:hypothetical protein